MPNFLTVTLNSFFFFFFLATAADIETFTATTGIPAAGQTTPPRRQEEQLLSPQKTRSLPEPGATQGAAAAAAGLPSAQAALESKCSQPHNNEPLALPVLCPGKSSLPEG